MPPRNILPDAKNILWGDQLGVSAGICGVVKQLAGGLALLAVYQLTPADHPDPGQVPGEDLAEGNDSEEGLRPDR